MKKCPSCDAINQDYDYDCGLCGATLSGIVSKSLEAIEAETLAKPRPRSEIHIGSLAVLATGLAATGAGLYLFLASGPIGLLLLLMGVPITAYVFGIDGSASPVPGKKWGGSGKSAAVRREIEENIAWERQKKGEGD